MTKTVEGVAELLAQLNELGNPKQTAAVLRGSAGSAMRVVMREARARIPRGKVPHKTYKGRLVAPGFASRSLRVVTSARDGIASAVLGVRAEAFYALQFLELGTAKIPRRPWLVPSFEAKQDEAIKALSDGMRKRIEKIAAKRGPRR